MIKVAIPHWQGRVSPVFDAAGHVFVFEIEAGSVRSRQDVPLTPEDPQRRAALVAATGADVLICGAISRPLEVAVSAAGIEVIPQTCGDIESVLAAYTNGDLAQVGFRMPGCCGRRRLRGGRCPRQR
jgi:predicted Fe-Mo cluster-binding NifX family protein